MPSPEIYQSKYEDSESRSRLKKGIAELRTDVQTLTTSLQKEKEARISAENQALELAQLLEEERTQKAEAQAAIYTIQQTHQLELKGYKQTAISQSQEIGELKEENMQLQKLNKRYKATLGSIALSRLINKRAEIYVWLSTLPLVGKYFDQVFEQIFDEQEKARRAKRKK